MKKNIHQHPAFTLVELLVVLAIIGLLIALLLPAVQQTRESARIATCKSRLHQAAVALHEYHSARKQFPGGVTIKDQGTCDGYQSQEGTNWMIAILPFMEEQPLYALYDDSQYNEAAVNQAVRLAPVRSYECPSDDFAGSLQVPAAGPAAPSSLNLPYASSSYRGVSGRSQGTVYLDSSAAINYPKIYRGVLHAVPLPGFTNETLSTIKDGASHTLMIGERTTITNHPMSALWANSYSFYSISAMTLQSRTLLGDYDACVAAAGTGGPWPCQRGWGSSHPRVINFALADASVNTIVITVDMTLLAQMSTIDGNETLSE
jgi:prepilin-type N-terminal cleavage/methylation domain-containing protein